LFLYLVMGMAGYLLSAFAGNFSVGASGAILGLLGLLIAIASKRGGMQMKEMRSRWISWVVTIFLLGFVARGVRADQWAHAGGFIAGFVLGKVFADRLPEAGQERTRAYALGWIAGIVLIASFVFMVLHYSDPIPGGD
jgi:membrane associated rhomboid family serine protease